MTLLGFDWLDHILILSQTSTMKAITLLLLTLVFAATPCPIAGADFFQRNEKEGKADDQKWFLRRAPDDERELQTMPECPEGYTLYKTFYNVLFSLTSEKEPMCSDDNLEIVGEILQDLFDSLLLESDEQSFLRNVGVLSTKTSVCDIYEDALQGNRRNENGNSNLNNSGRGNRLLLEAEGDSVAVDNPFDTEEEVGHRRRLPASVFRVYMFRSVGTCYMCYADNGDRRELQGNSAVARAAAARAREKVNEYFATVLSFMQDFMDIQLTKDLLDVAPTRGVTCLDDINAKIDTTVMIRFEEVEEECGDVFCCATYTNPQKGCNPIYSYFDYCHTSRDRCESRCLGMWINALDPPTCIGYFDPCSDDNDQCCEHSTCHSFDDENYSCIPDFLIGIGGRYSSYSRNDSRDYGSRGSNRDSTENERGSTENERGSTESDGGSSESQADSTQSGRNSAESERNSGSTRSGSDSGGSNGDSGERSYGSRERGSSRTRSKTWSRSSSYTRTRNRSGN